MECALLVNSEGRSGIARAREALAAGVPACDAIAAGVALVEADPAVVTVGQGGYLNLAGELECDAAIMDGATLQCGAVGALQGYRHPIRVARAVMEQLPHVFLAGAGAARFAREIGAEPADATDAASRERHRRWVARHAAPGDQARWPEVPLAPYARASARETTEKGTTVYLARDAAGHLAAATSTAGWPHKYPGRIGDTPLVGAGLYADDRYGACACTDTGELAIRAATARSVILYLKRGARLEEACHEAVADLAALAGGCQGPLVIHALGRDGEACVVASRDPGPEIEFCYWRTGMTEPRARRPRVI